jgi:hypothetical protein
MNFTVIFLLIFILATFFLALFVFLKRVFSKRLNIEDFVYIKAHWEDIIRDSEEDPIKAIMDADKILDYVLSRYGYHGSLGEKLKMAADKFSDVNGVWEAHKLRNRLAHEFVELHREDVKIALKRFYRALKDLGAKL